MDIRIMDMPQQKKRPGRKLKPGVNAAAVRELAAIGCTIQEIAYTLGCDEKTIDRNFRDDYWSGRSGMRVALRRKQVELALKGDRTLLIWLGKNYLDQTDLLRSETTVDQTTKFENSNELKQKLNELVMNRRNIYNKRKVA